MTDERDRLLKLIADKEEELERLLERAYAQAAERCGACNSENVTRATETDRWTALDLGELFATVIATTCADCRVRTTDWRAEEVREVVTRYARSILPRRGSGKP